MVAWVSAVGKCQVDIDGVLMQMAQEPAREVGAAFLLWCQKLAKRAAGFLKAIDAKLDPTKA